MKKVIKTIFCIIPNPAVLLIYILSGIYYAWRECYYDNLNVWDNIKNRNE